MEIVPLSIAGAYKVTTKVFPDDRGLFLEAFKAPIFEEATGRSLDVAQVNTSVSKVGTIRGIHYADVPPSQAKYVFCPSGAILDVIVDIRVGSPTFGQYETVLLDDEDRNAVFLSEGLGHAFISLADNSVATYLCSTTYAPGREHSMNPFCKNIGIDWPAVDRNGEPMEYLLTDKDKEAPGLFKSRDQGLLPTIEDTDAFLATLTAK